MSLTICSPLPQRHPDSPPLPLNIPVHVLQGNADNSDHQLNLQGFLVGNPWTDTATDNLGAVDFWWHHALISDETALGIRSNCNFSRIGQWRGSQCCGSSCSCKVGCEDGGREGQGYLSLLVLLVVFSAGLPFSSACPDLACVWWSSPSAGPLDAHPKHDNPQSREELCDDFCNR